jgi:Bax protein
MPDEFYEIKDVKERKEKFINIMLSVIEEVNLSLPEEERVPASIILAQSALETGWGQSRFLKEGNALFGEWTFIGKGIKPLNAEEGSNHKVRSFDTLHSSMKSYIGNINTSKHYREFRKMRSEGKSGIELAEGLKYYSEEGLDYIKKVKSMISYNNLSKYDTISVSSKKSWYEKIIDRI